MDEDQKRMRDYLASVHYDEPDEWDGEEDLGEDEDE